MKNMFGLILGTTIALAYSCSAVAEPQFLRPTNDLDDPRGYCLDIPGGGPNMRKDDPINTHTCKYDRPGFWNDEVFELTESNHLRMPEFDLCLTADSAETGSAVYTIDCALDKVHGWTLHPNGHLTPSDGRTLCLTASSERVYVNTSAGNLTPNSTRSISMQKCADDLESYQNWRWSNPVEFDTPTAVTLREGMDPALAAKIRQLGNTVNGRETAAAIAKLPRMFSAADVNISEEISYGSGSAQKLQVYSGVNRNHPRTGAPIILMVHGGGFLRGGLQTFAAPATHFAALGYVVVTMTYPLAPDATWPSGAQSVADAVRWITKNADVIKGNPARIFVLGQSAGGSLVADFVFRPSLIDGDSPAVAGAILASPVVALSVAAAPAGEKQYFGLTAEELEAKQTLGNIERSSIPVLILVAEFDPDKFQIGTARLFEELLVEKGVRPRIRQMRGHNHTSYIASVGTADTQAAEEILDFITTTGGGRP